MKRFEDLEAWQLAMDLAVELYRKTSSGPIEKDWGLKDQIRRAASSISANIAEGFERGSPAEFNRFVLIAKGSVGELRNHLILANRIGYFNKSETDALINTCFRLSAMLSGLSKYLRSNPKPPPHP